MDLKMRGGIIGFGVSKIIVTKYLFCVFGLVLKTRLKNFQSLTPIVSLKS